jgi:hypothetical protein
MQSLPFRSIADFLLLFLTLAAVGVMFRFHRFFPFETLMLAAAVVLSFRSQRDIWFLAVIAVVILAEGLPARSTAAEPASQEPQRDALWTVPLSLAATAVFVLTSAFATRIRNDRLEGSLAEQMPVKAVQIVREHQYPGALFNTYSWGGFLIWNLREPVSIDGRAGFYGDQRIDRSIKTWNGGPDWSSDPDLKSAGIVIAPVDAALAQLLRMDSRFSVAYEDKIAVVFVARDTQKPATNNLAALNPREGAHHQEKKL